MRGLPLGCFPGVLPARLLSLLRSRGLDQRPDLQALTVELREAEAEILLGQSLARPNLGVRGGLAREEGAEIVTAGVVVTLLVIAKGLRLCEERSKRRNNIFDIPVSW